MDIWLNNEHSFYDYVGRCSHVGLWWKRSTCWKYFPELEKVHVLARIQGRQSTRIMSCVYPFHKVVTPAGIFISIYIYRHCLSISVSLSKSCPKNITSFFTLCHSTMESTIISCGLPYQSSDELFCQTTRLVALSLSLSISFSTVLKEKLTSRDPKWS